MPTVQERRTMVALERLPRMLEQQIAVLERIALALERRVPDMCPNCGYDTGGLDTPESDALANNEVTEGGF